MTDFSGFGQVPADIRTDGYRDSARLSAGATSASLVTGWHNPPPDRASAAPAAAA